MTMCSGTVPEAARTAEGFCSRRPMGPFRAPGLRNSCPTVLWGVFGCSNCSECSEVFR
jgi:hypothetical protein